MNFYRSNLERITPYSPGKSIEEIQQRLGIEDVIKMASNENPLGVSPRVVEALSRCLPEVFRYPDGSAGKLTKKLADKYGLTSDQVAVGNGSDELIRQLSTAFLHSEDEVIYPSPTFSEYAWGARLMGSIEVAVPLTADDQYDVDKILAGVTSHTKLIYVCNPNNPTGTYLTRRQIQHLVENLPARSILVCDEAYAEYVTAGDYPDTIEWVREGRNVVILRTFSKAYSLAGLRLGYAMAPKRIIDLMKKTREPFSINMLAQTAGLAALDDTDHLSKTLRLNTKERDRLTEGLGKMGLVVTPSQSNFLWVKLPKSAGVVFEELLKSGVIVRSGEVWQRPYHIRVSVGTEEQNDRFINSLKRIIN
jgi:histidinol-phosphate aminotransferase